MPKKEPWPWKGLLCSNCAVVAANDDWSGVEPDAPVPLSLVPKDLYVIVACCQLEECTFDHVHDPHHEEDFQTPCDGCGAIGGRHGLCPAVADRLGGA